MQTALSDGQRLLRDSIAELLDQECTFERVREVEKGEGFDSRLWKQLGALGWLGLPFSESAGGGGGDLIDVAIVTEQLTRHAAPVPYAQAIAAGLTLSRFAQPETFAAQAGLIGGERLILPAILDAADSFDSLAESQTINGQATGSRYFVDYGQFASSYLTRVNRERVGLELIDANPEFVRRTEERTTGRAPAASIHFSQAPAVRTTGEDGYRFLLNLSRGLASVECLGNAAQALEMTVGYVQNRVQFGRPIGSFQAVQHHVANMATLVEAARFLSFEVMWAIDQGEPVDERAAVAKAFASRAAVEVTALAHQLHGGIGVTEEYNLRFFSLRAKERSLAWGTPRECVGIVAASIERETDWA